LNLERGTLSFFIGCGGADVKGGRAADTVDVVVRRLLSLMVFLSDGESAMASAHQQVRAGVRESRVLQMSNGE
jgi:hypothetical protein